MSEEFEIKEGLIGFMDIQQKSAILLALTLYALSTAQAEIQVIVGILGATGALVLDCFTEPKEDK